VPYRRVVDWVMGLEEGEMEEGEMEEGEDEAGEDDNREEQWMR
jgi:hypothetical protein